MAFTLPPVLTDTLAAVNIMLSSVGESPVSTVETPETPDVATALNTLEEVSRAVQSEGWPWNRDYNVTLSLDPNLRLPLPANLLRIARAYYSGGGFGNGTGADELVQRGISGVQYLYDPRISSFVFTAPVAIDMVTKLAFEDLPEAARRYITIRAAQQFQGRLQTSPGVDRILDVEVALARKVLDDEVDEVAQNNSISGNLETFTRIHGRGIRRRY